MTLRAGLLALILLGTGCGPAIDPAFDLLPLDQGPSWSYEQVASDATWERYIEASGVASDLDDQDFYVVRLDRDGVQRGNVSIVLRDDGWWHYDASQLEGQRLGAHYLPLPVSVGASWETEVRRNAVVVTENAEVEEIADLDTPAGLFQDCWVIARTTETRISGGDPTVSTAREWIAPGVGVVRLQATASDGTIEEVVLSEVSWAE